MTKDYTGGCGCGAVRFLSRNKPGPVVGCHCSQCRRQTGLYYASCDVSLEGLTIEGESSVRWYKSSDTADRGFCINCGSALFWRRKGSPMVSVMAGAFDQPSGLAFGYHIYCADKADFYQISDDAPQYPRSVWGRCRRGAGESIAIPSHLSLSSCRCPGLVCCPDP